MVWVHRLVFSSLRVLVLVVAFALAVAGASATVARAETALAAVAANFAGAAEELAATFAADTGHSLQLTTGSTGKLYAQIVAGAPFAVLLSADAKTPERLEAEGHAVPGSRFTYAIGRLTLYSRDPGRIGTDLSAALLADTVRFIAIANPELAPYGVAARQAMQSLGVWDQVQAKIVLGQNIGQAFSLVDSGAAEVGFVAASALHGPGIVPDGSWADVPQALFDPIRQDAILLQAGAQNAAALAFLAFLKTPKARAIAQRHGYDTE